MVEAPQLESVSVSVPADSLSYPTNLSGGDFPVKVFSQEMDHFASAGCVVSDGYTYYLLTNKHVSGIKGRKLLQ